MREISIAQRGGVFWLNDSEGKEPRRFDRLKGALDEATFRCRWVTEFTIRVTQEGKELRAKFRSAPTTKELEARGDTPECPDCGTKLFLQEGCVKCTACGYSEC